MWLLRGDLHEQQLPSAADRAETDRPTQPACLFLRPDRTYTFGRATQQDRSNDYNWREPRTASRRHVEIVTSRAHRERLQIATGQLEPTYTVTVKNVVNKAWALRKVNGAEFTIDAHTDYIVSDGDVVCFVAGGRRATFHWQPCDMLYTVSKRKDQFSILGDQTGVRSLEQRLRKEEPFTHLVTKLIHNITHVLEAGVLGLAIVNYDFVAQLERVLRPRNTLPLDDPQYDADDRLCRLERDFDAHWPRESQYLPEVPVDDTYGPRQAIKWLPNEARRTLFANTLIVDVGADEGTEACHRIIELAGGRVFAHAIPRQPAETDAGDLIANAVKAYIADHSLPPDTRIYLQKDPGAQNPRERALREAAHQLSAVGIITISDIVEAIYQADLDAMQIDDYRLAQRAESDGREVHVLAPPSSGVPTQITPNRRRELAPPSSIGMDLVSDDAEFPETQLPSGLAPAEGTELPESGTLPAAPEPAKKKLIRRAGQKSNLLDELFSESSVPLASQPYHAEAISLPSQIGTTQGLSSANDASQGNSVTQAYAGTSRTAGLKRRAGEARQLDFEFFEPQAVEKPSDASHTAEEVGAANEGSIVRPSTKRKAVTAPDTIVEEADGPTANVRSEPGSSKKKRLDHSSISKAKAKQGLAAQTQAAQHEIAERKAKYLQVDKGKRKVTQEEAELNKEFNSLKIVKPNLTGPKVQQGRKVGWRERDLDEEELRDMLTWDHDPAKSFFHIVRAPLGRSKPVAEQHNYETPAKWAGRPNYKAFRPKESLLPPRPPREDVALVLARPADFGIGDVHAASARLPAEYESEDDVLSYPPVHVDGRNGASKRGGTLRDQRPTAISEAEEDDDFGDGAPVAPIRPQRGKGEAAGASSASKQKASTARSKRPPAVESDGEVDADDRAEATTARRAPVARVTPRQRHLLTIDSSDEEDGLTFEGFGSKKMPAKRKRG